VHDDLHKEDVDRRGWIWHLVSGISHVAIDYEAGWPLGVRNKLPAFRCDDTVKIPPGEGLAETVTVGVCTGSFKSLVMACVAYEFVHGHPFLCDQIWPMFDSIFAPMQCGLEQRKFNLQHAPWPRDPPATQTRAGATNSNRTSTGALLWGTNCQLPVR
jgi:hypothetical protein